MVIFQEVSQHAGFFVPRQRNFFLGRGDLGVKREPVIRTKGQGSLLKANGYKWG